MVIEVLFWLVKILIFVARRPGLAQEKKGSPLAQPLALHPVLQYCSFSTMHGLVYISLWKGGVLRLYWTATFLGALSLGFTIVISSFIVRTKEAFLGHKLTTSFLLAIFITSKSKKTPSKGDTALLTRLWLTFNIQLSLYARLSLMTGKKHIPPMSLICILSYKMELSPNDVESVLGYGMFDSGQLHIKPRKQCVSKGP